MVINGVEYFDTAEAAAELGYSVHTLRNWRARKVDRGPAWIRRGKKIYYTRESLDEYMLSAFHRPKPLYFK